MSAKIAQALHEVMSGSRGPKPRDPVERFMDMVSPEPNSGCWLWMGGAKPSGYGVFGLSGKILSAHRFAYVAIGGKEIQEGSHLDHLCRVPGCVNPDHLEEVTPLENTRRSPHWRGHLTHCKRGHEFNEENTFFYTNGRGTARLCRACNRLRSQKRRDSHVS